MHLRRFVVVALLVAAGISTLPGPARAVDEPENAGSILVIMDVSGSMAREDATGTTLIAGARAAVRQLVAEAPPETPVGLRLYGHTYPGNDEERGCRDTESVVPIGPLTTTGNRITRAIERAKPTGFTPIGYSLQQAAKDFPPEGERTIVLVSDGEDTCGQPAPCQVARSLARQGIAVRVDTVGLFLQGNRNAREQLQCVAKATGGRYYPADNADALADRLSTASQRALERFQATGGEIDGGPAATQATVIDVGQDYVDDVRPGEARWYSVEAGTGQSVARCHRDRGRLHGVRLLRRGDSARSRLRAARVRERVQQRRYGDHAAGCLRRGRCRRPGHVLLAGAPR